MPISRGFEKNGYEKMPPIEEALACYLSMGKTSSLRAPSLPSKPLQVTSRLNGRAYAAAGQAAARVVIISSQVFGHLRSFKGWIQTEACVIMGC